MHEYRQNAKAIRHWFSPENRSGFRSGYSLRGYGFSRKFSMVIKIKGSGLCFELAKLRGVDGVFYVHQSQGK